MPRFFRIPSFPLICNVWSGTSPPPAPPRTTLKCQLRRYWGPGFPPTATAPGPSTIVGYTIIWTPKGSDLRDQRNGGSTDIIECPANSGRFYIVQQVDDVAKGFPNEFRFALVGSYKASFPLP